MGPLFSAGQLKAVGSVGGLREKRQVFGPLGRHPGGVGQPGVWPLAPSGSHREMPRPPAHFMYLEPCAECGLGAIRRQGLSGHTQNSSERHQGGPSISPKAEAAPLPAGAGASAGQHLSEGSTHLEVHLPGSQLFTLMRLSL